MATVRYGYLADRHPVEFTRSVYRGDRYDFVAEMRRRPERVAHGPERRSPAAS